MDKSETTASRAAAWLISDKPSFDRIDLRILELMLFGLPDAAIGRRLQLSHRTVQRRVRGMMAQVGALGRFSLGVRVGALGLLSCEETEV